MKQKFTLKKLIINEPESIMPKSFAKEIHYKTKTPIMLFRNKRRKVFDGILHHNEDLAKRDIEFQKAINDLIVKNLRYQLKTLVKDKEYGFLDDIKLNWQKFKIIKIQNRDSFEPVVVGEFRTSWELPRFIGQRIGDGFGEIIKLNSI
jgi:predicted phage-related endonuclease